MDNKTKDLVRYSASLSGLCHIYRTWDHRSLYTVDELFWNYEVWGTSQRGQGHWTHNMLHISGFRNRDYCSADKNTIPQSCWARWLINYNYRVKSIEIKSMGILIFWGRLYQGVDHSYVVFTMNIILGPIGLSITSELLGVTKYQKLLKLCVHMVEGILRDEASWPHTQTKKVSLKY